jgi:hypothetical protein
VLSLPETLSGESNALDGRCLVERATQSLRPHPTYERLCTPTLAARVGRVRRQAGPIHEPILTTTAGIIIDGYARWKVALERQQATLPCIEHALTEEEALVAVIRHHRGSTGLNDFCRIVLALELEPSLKDFASRPNATSSNLTNVKRDVRPELARAAGVSTGNVSKVKQLLQTAIPEVREALIRGELRIHRAWLWREQTDQAQRDSLWIRLHHRDVEKTIAQLVNAHAKKAKAVSLDPFDVANTIARNLGLQDVGGLTATIVDVPGKAVVITRAVYDEIRAREIE